VTPSIRSVFTAAVYEFATHRLGSPMYTLSSSASDRVQELWAVTAEGKKSLTIHPFTEALDAALTWAAESGGEIYRRDQPGAEPGLYNPAW
jgi:hypothetical protein